ncbi:MAG TPA: glycosyltransferase family 2 protein [Nitrospirota bacterium]|nr:glycosyltransferase family 2 protein [Nitrospirota bacterium]
MAVSTWRSNLISHRNCETAMTDHKRIFAILVNWNGFRDTIECLKSLFDKLQKDINIVILDNASSDGSLQNIEGWALENKVKYDIIVTHADTYTIQRHSLTIISLNSNLGFGTASNIGIRFAIFNNADYILLLNNDTLAKDDFLQSLMKTALSVPDAGIIGGLIRCYPNQGKVWFSGGHIDSRRGAFYHRVNDCADQRESDFITGCLMLIPVHVFQKVGYFDERYFLNVEDIEFSRRVKAAGYKIIVNCNAVIYHKVSATIGGLYSSRNQYYFHRNRMLFFSEQLSGIKKTLFFIFQFLLAIPAWMVIQCIKGNRQAVKGAILGYFDYFTGNYGKSKFY